MNVITTSTRNINSRSYSVPIKGTRLTKISSHTKYNAFRLQTITKKNIKKFSSLLVSTSSEVTPTLYATVYGKGHFYLQNRVASETFCRFVLRLFSNCLLRL